MDDLKFKTTFGFTLKPINSAEKTALASLEQLRSFIPNIDERNMDLLPVAFNAFVANRINANDDCVDTETALSFSNLFYSKPLNLEHRRRSVVGTIVSVAFSEFESDKPLTREQLVGYTQPFNVTLGAVIWRVVNSDIAEIIEENNSLELTDEPIISASWELMFSDYELLLLDENAKNLSEGTRITDKEEIKKYTSNLRASGGDGLAEKRRVYRLIKGKCLPVGVGLTTNPAADVKGIAVRPDTDDLAPSKAKVDEINKIVRDAVMEVLEEAKKTGLLASKSFSQSKDLSVNNYDKHMKFTTLAEITDETLKEANASVAVRDFFVEEIKRTSESWTKEKEAQNQKLKEGEVKAANLSAEMEKIQTELKATKESLDAVRKECADREKLEKFNVRMASLDADYDLDADDRRVISTDIQNLSDEAFAAYQGKLAVFLKEKSKAFKSANASKSADDLAIAAALKAAEKAKNLPNTTLPTDDLNSKYAKAFGPDGYKIVTRK